MSTTPILIPVVEPDVEQRALDRARQLAGPDQYRLSAGWLDAPGVFAMGEDNENHAGEHNSDSLARACAVFPEAQWFAASVFDGVPSELLRVAEPARALEWGADGEEPLGAVYSGQSFLLYSLDDPAVILYSENEYALVTGSEEFVRAYFRDLDEAARAFETFFAEQREIWARSEQMRDEIDRRRAIAFAQIRTPAG